MERIWDIRRAWKTLLGHPMEGATEQRPRIVILGSGFAGAYCAASLEKLLSHIKAEILVIDQRNYFLFYPLLVEAGTGSLEPRHAVVSIRAFLKKARFLMAKVVEVDFAGQQVRCLAMTSDKVHRVPYDHLVIALGSVTNLPAVSGLRAYGFEMKTLADAILLRDRAVELLETAAATSDQDERRELLHFVVVGANFTGVEVAGEFDYFLQKAIARYQELNAGDFSITLIERGDRILSALPSDLGCYATSKLRNRGITVLLNTTVTEITENRVKLHNGTYLNGRTVIWCAGIAANPLLSRSTIPKDEKGYIKCEQDLRVCGFTNVWAIGDCAVNIDAFGNAYPATAQYAVKQGQHLAKNLTNVFRGYAAKPCEIRSRGALAALGCRTGVASVFGVKVSGFTAWFLWRSVYLVKMPGLARKLRVALDWTMDLLFPRDYVQLSVHGTRTVPVSRCQPEMKRDADGQQAIADFSQGYASIADWENEGGSVVDK